MNAVSPELNQLMSSTPTGQCIICEGRVVLKPGQKRRRKCSGECTKVYVRLYSAARRDRAREVLELNKMNIADAAEEYASRGWKTIRLNGKVPMDPNWQRPKGFPKEHNGNLGIVTGAVSGLVVIDIDPKNGGVASLEDLEFYHGRLPGPRVRTGSGGLHIYLKHPGGKIPNSVSLIAPGIDVRGDGGQVCAPPSIHPDTGKPYVWEKAGEPAPMPQWLLKALTPKREERAKTDWPSFFNEPVKEGGRNQAVAKGAGLLLAKGLDEASVLALMSAWVAVNFKPPLSHEEVESVVESIARKHKRSP